MTARLRDLALRVLVFAFCWFTAAYAFIASSAFAYLQLSNRACSTGSARRRLARGGRMDPAGAPHPASVAAPGVRGAAAAVARIVWCARSPRSFDTVAHVVASLHDGPRSVAVGVASLLPVIDRLLITSAWQFLKHQSVASRKREAVARGSPVHDLDGTAMPDGRLRMLASVAHRRLRAGPASAGLASIASALLGHLLVFSAVFVTLRPGADGAHRPASTPCWRCPPGAVVRSLLASRRLGRTGSRAGGRCRECDGREYSPAWGGGLPNTPGPARSPPVSTCSDRLRRGNPGDASSCR